MTADPLGPARAAGRSPGPAVGEALAIAPDTFVVPGWWRGAETEPGLQLGSLVVRGERASAVVDASVPALAGDWLDAVLALVEPHQLRWVVLTRPGRAAAPAVDLLRHACPDATIVDPTGAAGALDLGGRHLDLLPTSARRQAVHDARHRVTWCDLVAGPLPGPRRDVAQCTDAELLAALASRLPHPGDRVVDRLGALDPRSLGSPLGPLARGAEVGRALALARRAARLPPAAGPTLSELLVRAGEEPRGRVVPG